MSEHFHNQIYWSCESMESERDQLLKTIATERDRFGKLETELKAEVARLKVKYFMQRCTDLSDGFRDGRKHGFHLGIKYYKRHDHWKERFHAADNLLTMAKSRVETLELENKLNAHVSLRLMTAKAEALAEAVTILHSRDSANKKLPHVLCHFCDLIESSKQAGTK